MATTADHISPVTVLLPVHNGGRHLSAAVASILNQTHSELELLAIDDGSTDGSGELLDAVEDPRVRVLHQANQGLVAALNTGLAEARYEFVARMDADDVSDHRRLALQARHLESHPRVAAVGCCYDVIDEQDVIIRQVHTAAEPAYLHRQLYFRNVLPHAGMMFRRAAVTGVGGYRDVGPVEDYDLWLRLASRHELASLPLPLLAYRWSPSGISVREHSEQQRRLKETRAALHSARPLPDLSARRVVRDGLAHARRFGPTCPTAVRTYVFDHVWLLLLAVQHKHVRTALRIACGLALFVLLRPSGLVGVLDVIRSDRTRRSDR